MNSKVRCPQLLPAQLLVTLCSRSYTRNTHIVGTAAHKCKVVMEWFLIMHLKKEHVFGMHTHNQIMQSWQEYGIIGLVAILALWGSVIWASRRSLTLNVIFLVILVQLITEVIDGGVTSIGFCFYIYLILLLLNSGEVGRDKKLLN